VSVAAGLLTLLLLVAVIAIVSAPLRSSQARRRAGLETVRTARVPWLRVFRFRGAMGPRSATSAALHSSDRATLEAAREAKYRELRDSELDYRTGKLSSADYAAIRQTLRAEAIQILDQIEAIDRRSGDLQQDDRVGEQKNREDDRPAIEISLHQRAATERARSAADAERPRESSVLAGVHEHEQDEHHGDDDLQ
jgi:hypothetical protein